MGQFYSGRRLSFHASTGFFMDTDHDAFIDKLKNKTANLYIMFDNLSCLFMHLMWMVTFTHLIIIIIQSVRVFAFGSVFLRNRIISASSPRMTPEDSLKSKPTAFQWAMNHDSTYHIGRAGRSIPAGRWKQR